MKIMLACAGGMSTGMLMKKMKEAAQAKGMEIDISACAVSELESHIEGCNVILLGPQVSYQKDQVAKAYAPVPVVVVDMMDYGMMKGEKVLNDVLAVLG